MIKNKVTIVLTIDDCKDCPHYRISDIQDSMMGAIHTCALRRGMSGILEVGGSRFHGSSFPKILIPDDCPILEVEK